MKYLMAILCLQMTVTISAQPINQAVGTGFPYPETYEYAMARQDSKSKRLPVILDLFSSSCVICFKSFPKLKGMQEKYASQLQFVMVGKEDGSIRNVYSRFEKKLGLSFPIVYDSVIGKKLQVKSYPVYIWLDTMNIVRGISTDVTEENIERFLSGKSLIPRKDMTVTGIFNPDSLFLINGNAGSDSTYLFRSMLTIWKNQRSQIPPSIYYGRPYAFKATCVTMEDLYRYAFYGYRQWDSATKYNKNIYPGLFVLSKDSLSVLKEDYKKIFCYSVDIADTACSYQRLQQIMQNDLENYFGYEAAIEEQSMPCWYLRAEPRANETLKSKGGERTSISSFAGIQLSNVPISHLISRIISRTSTHPIINQIGFEHNIDINLDAIMFDFEDIRKGLKVHGLELVEGKKMMKVLVLKPKKNNVAASL